MVFTKIKKFFGCWDYCKVTRLSDSKRLSERSLLKDQISMLKKKCR